MDGSVGRLPAGNHVPLQPPTTPPRSSYNGRYAHAFSLRVRVTRRVSL